MLNIGTLPRRALANVSRWRDGFRVNPFLRDIRKSQYYSPERLLELQWTRIKRMVDYAYENVPYYHGIFKDNGVDPGDLKSIDDFRKLPLLTKADIRGNLDGMVSRQFAKEQLINKKTGGSTGVPIHLYWDRNAVRAKKAAVLRHDGWAGFRPGDWQAVLWGAEEGSSSLRARIYNVMVDGKIWLDTLGMSDENIFRFVKEIRGKKPKTLMGHAHSLYILAQYLKKNDISGLGIKAIISTAEVLSDGERDKIEEIFGAPIFNRYGCEELSIVASECEYHRGLHVNSEGVFVEILGGDDGNPGEMVITDLVNFAMPFIRYKIEDMSNYSPKGCPCGRGLPLLTRIYGRTSDFLYTPEGKMLSGISIMDHFAIGIPGVWQVQVIQDRMDHLHFRIVKTDGFNDKSMAELKARVPEFFGPRMKYDVDFVDRIEPNERGKYRFAICRIPEIEG